MIRTTLLAAAIISAVAVSGPLVWGARHRAHALDGDTIVMDGRHLRIAGIDAPEIKQQCTNADGRLYDCGRIAKAALEELIHPGGSAGNAVACVETGERSYDRSVVTCTLAFDHGPGLDLGAAMVWLGMAIDYPRYSHGRYAGEQDAAKLARRGIWQGSFLEPEVYRHGTAKRRQ